MSKLIALRSAHREIFPDAWNSDFSNLKQQALLFDQIGIFHLSRFYKSTEETLNLIKNLDSDFSNKLESIITELKWLQQIGVVSDLTIQKELSVDQFMKTSSSQIFEYAKSLLKKVLDIETVDLKSVENETQKKELIKKQQFILLRVMSVVMEITRGVTAVTTSSYIDYTRDLPNTNKSIIAQIVIDKLPLPNNDTPWEQIIDYRNDPKNQESLLSLRRWIRKISTENLSSSEIADELQWLMNEFQNHMKIHKMKANTETLEIIVKAPLEIVEDLVKLKFSKIPEPFFALKKRQINLMEAELSAPGKEMAYIIKTRDTFQSQE